MKTTVAMIAVDIRIKNTVGTGMDERVLHE
jgi:hypothetical protein